WRGLQPALQSLRDASERTHLRPTMRPIRRNAERVVSPASKRSTKSYARSASSASALSWSARAPVQRRDEVVKYGPLRPTASPFAQAGAGADNGGQSPPLDMWPSGRLAARLVTDMGTPSSPLHWL